MERVAQVFTSFADADQADDDYYASLSGNERVSILLDLVEHYTESLGEAAQRFERVCRITELTELSTSSSVATPSRSMATRD